MLGVTKCAPSLLPRPSTLDPRLRIFVFDLDLLDFLERNHHLLGSVAALDLEVKVICCNAADALAGVSVLI